MVVNIRAPGMRIWQLLTDAEGFPRWNSTVTRIEGQHPRGRETAHPCARHGANVHAQSIRGDLRRSNDVGGRQFPVLFTAFELSSLTPCRDGSVDFAMNERFSGLVALVHWAFCERQLRDYAGFEYGGTRIFPARRTAKLQSVKRDAERKRTHGRWGYTYGESRLLSGVQEPAASSRLAVGPAR